MDEEAKRVYMLLPEAIEIETAYMSCTQAAESCNGVIGELKTPIYPKAEQIPISEKPKPYNGKSFDDMMPRIAMICYVANIIALILLMCLDGDGDMGYRILIGALSFMARPCCVSIAIWWFRWTCFFNMSRTLSIGNEGPRAVNLALGPVYLGRNSR